MKHFSFTPTMIKSFSTRTVQCLLAPVLLGLTAAGAHAQSDRALEVRSENAQANSKSDKDKS